MLWSDWSEYRIRGHAGRTHVFVGLVMHLVLRQTLGDLSSRTLAVTVGCESHRCHLSHTHTHLSSLGTSRHTAAWHCGSAWQGGCQGLACTPVWGDDVHSR